MKKALISATNAAMHDILEVSISTFCEYARRHHYDFVLGRITNQPFDPTGKPAKLARWAKIDLIKRTLENYDVVVWLDADVIITNFEKDLCDDFPQDCFQALVMEQFPMRFNPNTGVWAIRKDAESTRFLEEVSRIGQLQSCWADQAAVCRALGWEVEENYRIAGRCGLRARPVHYSSYLARTSWLPPEWNPLGMAARWPSRFLHFAGMEKDDRLNGMKAILADLKKREKLPQVLNIPL